MSVVILPDGVSTVSEKQVRSLATKAGVKIPDEHISDFQKLLQGLDSCAQEVTELEDYIPKANLELYPRTDIHIPKDTNGGGWATKATVKCTKPTNNLLAGVTIALKDNIALAGVRCTNGTMAVDWTPDIDATVVTRILDAGGIIAGKAACENNCFGAVSDTSCTGPVHNPYANGYSCGGSSSGSARLVGVGAVDMAIGCDQGGSIRLPSATCGLVGLKPTWGLVPYTGIISLEATIDHAGPMTKTVAECAALMDVIAGADGIDDRQQLSMKHGTFNYAEQIAKHLQCTPDASLLKGIRVGILEEGFMDPSQDPNIESTVRAAAEKFKTLGADVRSTSIPLHREAAKLWMCAMPLAGTRQGLLSDLTGRKGLFMTDRISKADKLLTQEAFDSLGAGGENIYLRGLFLEEKYGPAFHAKCMNLLRKINDLYDAALKEFDVLVMPTVPFPPVKLKKAWNDGQPLERLIRTTGITANTAPLNSTGHPGLTLPVGFVPAKEEPDVKLPAGMQIMGRKFEDGLCMKVGAAWEKVYNWKDF